MRDQKVKAFDGKWDASLKVIRTYPRAALYVFTGLVMDQFDKGASSAYTPPLSPLIS